MFKGIQVSKDIRWKRLKLEYQLALCERPSYASGKNSLVKDRYSVQIKGQEKNNTLFLT